jgi:hypothetical protein
MFRILPREQMLESSGWHSACSAMRGLGKELTVSNNPMGNLGNVLGSLFGQDTPDDIRQFDDRYNRGRPEDLDDYEVQQRYRQVLRNAPPEVIEDAHADAFAQLSPEERRQLAARLRQQAAQLDNAYTDPYDRDQDDDDPRTLARMARQAEQRNPNILDQLFGNQQGPLNNPMVKMALAGAAAMAARRFLSGQTGGQAKNQMGGGSQLPSLGDLFGGMNSGFNQRQGGSGDGGFRGGGTQV